MKTNKTLMKIIIGITIVLLMGTFGCSKSKKTDSLEDELLPSDASVTQEAQTDVVPEPTPAENPQPAPEPQKNETVTNTTPPPPEETPKPEAKAPISEEYQDYTVQSGDTLMKIAFETYGDLYRWNKIYELNKDKVTNPNSIAKGTVLKLEKSSATITIEKNGDQYLIKKGDTLVLISTDIYGKSSKWKKIWENNKQLIRDPNRIFAGFYLYYTMTAEEKDEAGKLKLHQQVKPAPIVKQDQPDTNGTAQIGSPAVSMDQLAPPIDTSAASPSEVNERNPATK